MCEGKYWYGWLFQVSREAFIWYVSGLAISHTSCAAIYVFMGIYVWDRSGERKMFYISPLTFGWNPLWLPRVWVIKHRINYYSITVIKLREEYWARELQTPRAAEDICTAWPYSSAHLGRKLGNIFLLNQVGSSQLTAQKFYKQCAVWLMRPGEAAGSSPEEKAGLRPQALQLRCALHYYKFPSLCRHNKNVKIIRNIFTSISVGKWCKKKYFLMWWK